MTKGQWLHINTMSVPLGLLEGARLVRDVQRGAVLTSDDVELDVDPLLRELRSEMAVAES